MKSLTALLWAAAAATLVVPAGPPRAAAADEVRFGTVTPICAPASSAAVHDGEPVVVDVPPYSFTLGRLDPDTWRTSPSPDPNWTMWWNALRWAQGLAVAAEAKGQHEVSRRVVDQVARFYDEVPDPGTSTPTWNEGTSLRRLETLNCLYFTTRDRRIPAMMAREVAVQFGPRYYGPPGHPVHNHGLMANQFVIAAGSLTRNADWIRRAAARMGSEIDLAFSAAGVNHEQSAAYHKDNDVQWAAYAGLVEEVLPGSPIPAHIRSRMSRVRQATYWLTEPDGMVTSVGDSLRVPGLVPERRPMSSTFRDDATGWFVHRTSWTDPRTSYLVVRYGPKTKAHGHPDKASLVWSTAGSRVLNGPGYDTYDPVNPKAPWWKKPSAHNVAVPRNRALSPTATARLVSAKTSGSSATVVTTDAAYGVTHLRYAIDDPADRRLVVTDVWPRGVASTQYFHLDHTWRLVSRTATGLVARSTVTGRTLTMTTQARIARVSVGSRRYQDGYQMLGFGTRKNNISITVDSGLRSTRTIFTVR